MNISRWKWLVVALVLGVVFFGLGNRGLNEPDEGRYVSVGAEMVSSGDWLVPHLNGVEHLSKPAITYWLIALSVKAFGANEFAARLPAALAALGTLLAVYLLAASIFDEATGLWAVVVLLSSLEFFVMARLITPDMILTCCVTWSLWTFWRWYVSPQRRWSQLAWFYVCLGLGMMVKGPVAVVLPLFGIAVLRWRNPRFTWGEMGWGRGLLLFLAIAAPWFVALIVQRPDLWHYFIVRETLERFATSVHRRGKPWWFFFPVLAGGFLPWTTLLPATMVLLRRLPDRARDGVHLCAGWVVLGLILFTLSKSKLPSYVLTLIPALAVLMAGTLPRLVDNRTLVKACSAITPLIFTTSVAVLILTQQSHYHLSWAPVVLLLGLTVIGLLVSVWFWRTRSRVWSVGATAVTALAAYLVCAVFVPSIERNLRSHAPAKYFAERIQQEDPGQTALVIAHNVFPYGVPFYLRRHIVRFQSPAAPTTDAIPEFRSETGADTLTTQTQFTALWNSPQRVFCIANGHRVADFRRENGDRVWLLEKVGLWALLSNQPSRQP